MSNLVRAAPSESGANTAAGCRLHPFPWPAKQAATAVGVMVIAMGREVARESFVEIFGATEPSKEPSPGLGQGALIEGWLSAALM